MYLKDGCYLLAEAIICQAAQDYRKAILNNNQSRIQEIEHFFNSKYFGIFSSIDGDYLIKKLRQSAEQAKKKAASR